VTPSPAPPERPEANPNVIPAASGSEHAWDIVDAQIHLNRLNIGPTLLAMDALGIRSAVIGEYWGNRPDGASMPGYRLTNGAPRALALSAEIAGFEHPDRFSYFLRADYRDPELNYLAHGVSMSPSGRGLRIAVLGPPGADHAAFRDGDYSTVFAAGRTYGLPIFVLYPGAAREISDYAQAYPDVTIIVDHTGMPWPDESGGTDEAAFDDVLALSGFPNVAVKWSHAPYFFNIRAYPFAELMPVLRRAIDAFGPQRLMWASDITMNATGHSWAELLFYLRESSQLTVREKQWILGGTARALLGWPRDGNPAPWTT
jgi:predicted TIM-barrel fold metal-dependent hydrolase